MLDYFLTAFVRHNDLDRARAVLQGVCAMPGEHEIKRVLMYRGPDRPDGFKKLKSIEKTANSQDRTAPPNKRQFVQLQGYLAKQSYFLRLEYPVKERDFVSGAQLGPVDRTPGTLRWTEIPEPVKGDELHIRQQTLVIANQENLVTLMEENNHKFQAEFMEESYTYCLDNVEYLLFRYVVFPQDSTPQGPSRSVLPPIHEMQSLFPTWYLRLTVLLEEPDPELSATAVEMLMSARQGLGTCFSFRQQDRRLFDTRVAVGLARNAAPQQLGKVIPVERQS